jgi:hypothetical protein
MPYLEMRMLVIAVATFSAHGQWAGKKVICHTDCEDLLAVNEAHSKDPGIQSLTRSLAVVCAQNSCVVRLVHIAGKKNVYADLLSRSQVDKFKELMPSADASPTAPSPIPTHKYA